MSNVRYQLKVDTYMQLDGQWGIVQSGTVFDDAPTVNYSPATVTVLSPTEPASALGSAGKATPVRNVRRR